MNTSPLLLAFVKEAHKYPLSYSANNNSNDISHILKKHIQSKQADIYNNVSPWYKQMLQTSPQSIYQIPPNTNKKTQILLHRIRLGHTKLTNAHYMDRTLPNTCPFCHHSPIDIQHIIIHCPSLSQHRSESFQSLNPINTISNPTPDNTIQIITFLEKAQIKFKI